MFVTYLYQILLKFFEELINNLKNIYQLAICFIYLLLFLFIYFILFFYFFIIIKKKTIPFFPSFILISANYSFYGSVESKKKEGKECVRLAVFIQSIHPS